jgi:hypothetical protein
MTRRIWQALRPLHWLAALVIAYAIAHLVLGRISAHRGILTPDGDVDRGYAMFAIAVLGLRILVVVLVPIVVTYRIVMRLTRSLDPPPS